MVDLRALLLVAACFAIAATSASFAQERRVALVIGNGAYVNVGRLDNPGRDAEAVAQALREAGFEVVQVERDLGRDGMVQALRRFEAAADDSDWALVYYAGHGIEVGGVNYLIPIDTRLRSDRDVEDETISLPQVQKRLEGARRLRIVILDACRDNPFLAAMKRTLASRAVGRGLARPELPQSGSLVAYSAAAGQVAADGSTDRDNSPYVAALIHQLAVPDVEVNLFFRRVRSEVLRATGQKQEPATYESLPEERFVFKPSSPDVAAIGAGTQQSAAPVTVAALPSGTVTRRTDFVATCDRLAASPTDRDRPPAVRGVVFNALDPGSAVPACRAAVEVAPDDRRVRYQFGRSLAAGHRYEEARSEYEKAAAAGSAPAMTNLGVLLLDGLGGERNAGAALRWYEKAASEGEVIAMLNLGASYESGKGVEQNYTTARSWYEKAAAAGNAAAMSDLGILYDNGRGVERDSAAARVWFEKAAAAGNTIAMRNMGILTQYGRGGPKDLTAARDWYERAASRGNGQAMRHLGVLYERGEGVTQDLAAARAFYERAFAAGDASAAFDVGLLYEVGHGVPKDFGTARDWYERGANAGHAAAIRALGIFYGNGYGGPRDDKRAVGYFDKAAAAGDTAAMYNLALFYASGRGIKQDYAAARGWYEKSAAAGNVMAMNNLGVLYGTGRGGPRNYVTARNWYEKAANGGNELARRNLTALGRKGL